MGDKWVMAKKIVLMVVMVVADILVRCKLAKSRGEARRLVE